MPHLHAYLGGFEINRGRNVSAALGGVRCSPMTLLPHDHAPKQRHGAEHVRQRLEHSITCITDVHRIAGDQGLTGGGRGK